MGNNRQSVAIRVSIQAVVGSTNAGRLPSIANTRVHQLHAFRRLKIYLLNPGSPLQFRMQFQASVQYKHPQQTKSTSAAALLWIELPIGPP